MIFEVEMVAFKKQGRDFGVRPVDVPDKELSGNAIEDLDRIFHWGQNDFQPKQFPSVSVGDVIRYKGKRYIVKGMGFEEVDPNDEGGFEKGYGIRL